MTLDQETVNQLLTFFGEVSERHSEEFWLHFDDEQESNFAELFFKLDSKLLDGVFFAKYKKDSEEYNDYE